MNNQWSLMLLYLSFFCLWLPLSLWKAFRSRTHRSFWRAVALLLWCGLALALIGRYGAVPFVREAGALMIFFGLLGVFFWIVASVLRSVRSIKLRR